MVMHAWDMIDGHALVDDHMWLSFIHGYTAKEYGQPSHISNVGLFDDLSPFLSYVMQF